MSKKDNYFTLKKSIYTIDIEGTNLEPTKLTFLGGMFIRKYREQLDRLLDKNFEGMKDLSELFTLLMIVEAIEEKEYPIYLRCNLSNTYKKDLIKALERFIRDNNRELHLIKEIYLSQIEKTIKPIEN